MKRIDHGFGAAGLIILAATLTVFMASLLPVIKSEANLKTSDWLGFAGNFLAAAGTIFAGWLAWRAAMRTIEIQQELAARRERKIYTVVSGELTPFNEMYDLMWRTTDVALTNKRTEFGPIVDQITGMWEQLPSADDLIESVAKLVENLDPLKEKEFREVIEAIRFIDRQFEEAKVEAEDDSGWAADVAEMYQKIEYANRGETWLIGLRTQFSHYIVELEKFNPTLAKLFDARTKHAVDHRSVAAFFEPIIAAFEKTGKFS